MRKIGGDSVLENQKDEVSGRSSDDGSKVNTKTTLIESRKEDHIDICLKKDVKANYNHWDDIHLIHQALPEIDMKDIDTSVKVLGKELSFPLIITAITGGYPDAEKINSNLASAASKFKIGLGVGSQRAGLEDPNLESTYAVVKDFDIPLVIGNIGAPQLIKQHDSKPMDFESIDKALEMVGADVLAIHMNYLQEVVQPEGNTNAAGCLDMIKEVAGKYPLIAKETGCGVSMLVAVGLKDAGVIGIDVGGYSGTSFSAVEFYRAIAIKDKLRERLGDTFWDWGIPTPVSVIKANVGLDLIATGGIRNGLDIAKALVLGANSAGMAGELLNAATESSKMVEDKLEAIIQELKAAMFLVGAKNISELKNRKYVITGRTKEWLDL
jgi:isopentenyl-diphosphate delta-isomerase